MRPPVYVAKCNRPYLICMDPYKFILKVCGWKDFLHPGRLYG